MKEKKSVLTPVFYVSVSLAAVFILWGAFFPENVGSVLGVINNFISNQLGWVYMLGMTAFVIFAIYLVFSPYGKIRLGRQDEKPQYSYFTWFSFLFTAGMGVGLVFYGVNEPVTHFHNPPSAEPGSIAAQEESMMHTLFHWGIHPWGVYAVVGLSLAYFNFRHNAPLLMSSALSPLIGERSKGWLGTGIDSLAVFGTIFGIATSLGLGATQITAGLSYSFDGIENNVWTQTIIVLIITVAFMISASTGVNKGIRYLSIGNVIIAIALMLFVFIFGSSVQMLEAFMTNLGNYLNNIVSMTFNMNSFTGERSFLNDWTLFYWAWWIGWAAFVGSFIARVSRGRTIREFIVGVMGVPVVFSAIWFAIFGVAGIESDNILGGGIYSLIETEGNEVALFAFLENYPAAPLIMGVAILLIASFFVTSADSGTFVISMLTTGGSLNPPLKVKLIWGGILAGTAIVLLWSGGLSAIEMAMLIAAFPFTFIVAMLGISLYKALRSEYGIIELERQQLLYKDSHRVKTEKELEERREAFEETLPDEIAPHLADDGSEEENK
ncbi:BCCT family transporter [Jeotgalicoccus huakuii]|uniref:BCCT family transporter n=1 Tax=unclassified Jeotgalicoccus TaxID=2630462 RepID=UPI001415189F|nr:MULTISPECIES: BCCT family transporter [unclassified Jeotgalicoccus]MCK1976953.1 BCCT family transporter [Jeotgalicoccus huakuii]QQD84595.1 BCCT family transporter [Jeotgalicoccus sp. ATCC 8456]